MKEEKFKTSNLIKELIMSIDKYFVNFPNKERELKRTIKEVSNKLLLDCYIANASTNAEKRKNIQEDMVAEIKYLDFMINIVYEKQIINSKKYLKFGESLSYILKHINAWRNVGYGVKL